MTTEQTQPTANRELIKRLRRVDISWSEVGELCAEAADALEALSRPTYAEGVEAAAKALEVDAQICDCAAREEGECACGAWCEWKSITSARAVEIVRTLTEGEKP